MVILTASPLAGPSPRVTLWGAGLMPRTTVFGTEKLGSSTLAVACSVPRLPSRVARSEEHTSELQSRSDLVCRLLLEKKKKKTHERNLNLNKQRSSVRKSVAHGCAFAL